MTVQHISLMYLKFWIRKKTMVGNVLWCLNILSYVLDSHLWRSEKLLALSGTIHFLSTLFTFLSSMHTHVEYLWVKLYPPWTSNKTFDNALISTTSHKCGRYKILQKRNDTHARWEKISYGSLYTKC